MGVVEATKNGIGLEGSGVVRRIGPNVQDLNVGDRVIIFEHGCFSTRLVLSSKLCAKIPRELSFEEAATLPCVYSTVIYSLLNIGRLEKDQVLNPQDSIVMISILRTRTDSPDPICLRRRRLSSYSDLQNEGCSSESCIAMSRANAD